MKKIYSILIILGLVILAGIVVQLLLKGVTPRKAKAGFENSINYQNMEEGSVITLPEAVKKSQISLEEALVLRRSVRRYGADPLEISHVSQLLWAAQGISNERGFRTAPSAGATFPLEMFVVVNRVNGLPEGLYHYLPQEHKLKFIRKAHMGRPLMEACLSQAMLEEASFVLVFGAIFERTTNRYGERGIRYVHNEIGHASQNVHLQAAALNLGTVVIGAYRDNEVDSILQLGSPIQTLYLMPVGHME